MAATVPASPLVPALTSPPPRPGPRLGAAAMLALGLGAVVSGALVLTAPPAPRVDPCAVPGGVEFDGLSPADRSWLAHRLVACSDRAHGRITAGAYRDAIAAIDRVPEVATPAPALVWAATVRGASSQWSADAWSAARVLGPPEVYPRSGDDARAWASRGADDQVEWIEVGLAQPRRLAAVQIAETYNPGAITRVELYRASGAVEVAYAGAAVATGPAATLRTIGFACTAEPIVAIRVTLDSAAVAGWNELDAIGGQPCD